MPPKPITLWLNETQSIQLDGNLGKEFATRKRTPTFSQSMKVLPDPDEVLKKAGKTRAAFTGLLDDGHLWSCAQSRESGVLALEWKLEQDASTPEVMELCYKALDIIETADEAGGLPELISSLLRAPMFGYAVAEVMWDRDEQGNLLPFTIIPKPMEWFHFDSDGHLRFKSKDNREGELCPARRMLLVRHKPTLLNPYGNAVLSKCYWPVMFKRQLMRYGLTFAEKYGMPYLVGTYDSDFVAKSEVDIMLDELDAMIGDGIIAIPKEWTAAILEASKSGSVDVYTRFITMFNAEISKAVLSQTLTTEQGDTGSYAMSQTHLEVRSDIVDADTRLIERAMNTLMRWITELNFMPGTKPPRFKLYEEKDVSMERADRDTKLVGAGMLKFTKKYVQKTYGLDEDDFELTDQSAPAPMAEATGVPAIGNTDTSPKPTPTTHNPPLKTDDVTDLRNKSNAIARSAGANPEASGKALDTLLAPVFDLIKKGGNFAEVSKHLATIFPNLDTAELEDTLAKAIFTAEVMGRV